MKELDIVFVHLNTEIPKYLIANLKRTVRIFPNNRVVLITNKDILDTVLRCKCSLYSRFKIC